MKSKTTNENIIQLVTALFKTDIRACTIINQNQHLDWKWKKQLKSCLSNKYKSISIIS